MERAKQQLCSAERHHAQAHHWETQSDKPFCFFQICECIYNNKSIVTKEVKLQIDIHIGDYIIH